MTNIHTVSGNFNKAGCTIIALCFVALILLAGVEYIHNPAAALQAGAGMFQMCAGMH